MKYAVKVADAIAGFTDANFKPHAPLLEMIDSISVGTNHIVPVVECFEGGGIVILEFGIFSVSHVNHVNHRGAPIVGDARDIAEIMVGIVPA